IQPPGGRPGRGPNLHDAARPPERAADPTLGDYLAVIRRRRRALVLSVLLAIALAIVVSLVQTTQYQVEAEILLRPSASEQLLADERGQIRPAADAERQLNNEIRLAESAQVRTAVKNRYHGPLHVKDVRAYAPSSDTIDVLRLSLTTPHPEQAATLANLYA